MILCAGLTPAWQQMLVFEGFRYGEVNRAREVHWCASGKVFNAAISAHHLGAPALALAPVGGHAVAMIEEEFDDMGLPYRWILTQSSTRVCTTILDEPTGTMTELVENGRPLLPEELDAYRQAYVEEVAEADFVVLIGSLPIGTPESFYRELLERTPCPAVLDFRGQGLLDVLDLEPFVVKPNREELAKTLGRPLDTDADLLAAMRMLNDRGAHWVVVSQGPGPVWASSLSEVYRFQSPPVDHVVKAIGCGDAMAATIAWATRNGRNLPDSIRLAIAAANQNLRQLLPCRLDPSRLADEADLVQVEQLAV